MSCKEIKRSLVNFYPIRGLLFARMVTGCQKDRKDQYLHEVSLNSFLVTDENMGLCLYILTKRNIFFSLFRGTGPVPCPWWVQVWPKELATSVPICSEHADLNTIKII